VTLAAKGDTKNVSGGGKAKRLNPLLGSGIYKVLKKHKVTPSYRGKKKADPVGKNGNLVAGPTVMKGGKKRGMIFFVLKEKENRYVKGKGPLCEKEENLMTRNLLGRRGERGASFAVSKKDEFLMRHKFPGGGGRSSTCVQREGGNRPPFPEQNQKVDYKPRKQALGGRSSDHQFFFRNKPFKLTLNEVATRKGGCCLPPYRWVERDGRNCSGGNRRGGRDKRQKRGE